MRGAMHAVRNDMILLENQIPLFVLDLLLGIHLGNPEQNGAVASLVVRFFDPLMPTDAPLLRKDRSKLESSVGAAEAATAFDPLSALMLHCLDVFRRNLLRAGLEPMPPPPTRLWLKMWSGLRRVADKRRQQFVHCVSELREAMPRSSPFSGPASPPELLHHVGYPLGFMPWRCSKEGGKSGVPWTCGGT
jgi:hypothetical protein